MCDIHFPHRRSYVNNAPPDFAANLDLYVIGEKRAEPDLH